jgi:hypothetical protein
VTRSACLLAFVVFACRAAAEEPGHAVEVLVGRLSNLQAGPEREQVVTEILGHGPAAREALLRLARGTKDSRMVLDIADVAARIGFKDVGDICLARLLATDPSPLPGYLGTGAVRVLGEAEAYQRLEAALKGQLPEVRGRILHAIGYSGYGARYNPVPLLYRLYQGLKGKEKALAEQELIFALRQRRAYVLPTHPLLRAEAMAEPHTGRVLPDEDAEAVAGLLLRWILQDRRFDGTEPGRPEGRSPYPPEGRIVKPPFAIAFEEMSGGVTCYTLADGQVRRIGHAEVRTRLEPQLCRADELLLVSFSHIAGDEETTVEVLFRKADGAWVYGGVMRVRRGIVCFF